MRICNQEELPAGTVSKWGTQKKLFLVFLISKIVDANANHFLESIMIYSNGSRWRFPPPRQQTFTSQPFKTTLALASTNGKRTDLLPRLFCLKKKVKKSTCESPWAFSLMELDAMTSHLITCRNGMVSKNTMSWGRISPRTFGLPMELLNIRTWRVHRQFYVRWSPWGHFEVQDSQDSQGNHLFRPYSAFAASGRDALATEQSVWQEGATFAAFLKVHLESTSSTKLGSQS